MTTETHAYTYEKGPDGKYRKISTSESEPRQAADILNEYIGCAKQERRLLEELKECREHYAAIAPVAEEIIAENKARNTKAQESGPETAPDADLEALNELRLDLKQSGP